jgi:signal transduction histidine kinase
MAMERKLDGIRKGNALSDNATLEEILDLIKKCMSDNKRIQHNLRPSVLDLLGLAPALRALCREFEAAYSIKTNCILEIDGMEVSEALKIIIYRISQEALTNAAKHSGAEKVCLSLTQEDRNIRLMIEDDGCGFDTKKALGPKQIREGIGLASMKERCELSGGTFSIHSRKGEGTTVHASWVCS